MPIQIREYADFRLSELLPLYKSVGWVNYTASPERLEAACRGSLKLLAAWDGGRLVGLLRLVGDGCSILYVQDLLVLPDRQGQGVGSALLRAGLDCYPDVYQVVLLTDDRPATTAFYQKCGLKRIEEFGCCAFVRFRI